MNAGTSFAIVANKAAAQAICDAVWIAVQGNVPPDVRCADGVVMSPAVTTGWAAPMQRVTDGLWTVPLHPTIKISGQALLTTATYSPTWFAPPPLP